MSLVLYFIHVWEIAFFIILLKLFGHCVAKVMLYLFSLSLNFIKKNDLFTIGRMPKTMCILGRN